MTNEEDAPEREQVLASYPLDYCPNCRTDTGFDGWGMGIGGIVDFYCMNCGKKKYSKPWAEVFDRRLRQEIMEVITHE